MEPHLLNLFILPRTASAIIKTVVQRVLCAVTAEQFLPGRYAANLTVLNRDPLCAL